MKYEHSQLKQVKHMARDKTPNEHVESALHAMGAKSSGLYADTAVEALQAEYDLVPKRKGLVVRIGPSTNQCTVLLDGEDITGKLLIKSIAMPKQHHSERLMLALEVYAEAELEVLPEGVTVNVVDPASPAIDTLTTDRNSYKEPTPAPVPVFVKAQIPKFHDDEDGPADACVNCGHYYDDTGNCMCEKQKPVSADAVKRV